jgi:hypothetical protein
MTILYSSYAPFCSDYVAALDPRQGRAFEARPFPLLQLIL